MRRRLFVPSVAALTLVLLGVSVGESRAQTPSTVFVGVVTVTSPPVAPVPPTPGPQVTGTRRTVSCRTYYRGHGKRRHVLKRVCRKRRMPVLPTRRSVSTVVVASATFVVPPPPTFAVAPPPPPVYVVTVAVPPTFTVAPPPPPVYVVTVAVAPVVKDSKGSTDSNDNETHRADPADRAAKNKAKQQAKRDAKEEKKEKEKNRRSRGDGRGHDD